MAPLSRTPFGVRWLGHFSADERDSAAALMDEVLLVGSDELRRGIYVLLDQIMSERADATRPIALFAEREITNDAGSRWTTRIPAIYPGTEHGRATGLGVSPIVVNSQDQEVGSEGAIANLITSYCRLHAPMALSHPGPDEMRAKRVGRIVIVTDFIGSGNRVWEMLEAFWAVATLRSWRSYGLIDFCVAAHSGTEAGLSLVRQSRLAPTLTTLVGCPTVRGVFAGGQLAAVEALCRRYPPGHKRPFGFRKSGALIAFTHGVPNNAPAILHSDKNGWIPLFPHRSAAASDLIFPVNTAVAAMERAKAALHIHRIRDYLDSPRDRRWITAMIVLAAIEAGARTPEAISSRSYLDISEIVGTLRSLRLARWVSITNHLTRLGRQELAHLRRRRRSKPILPSGTISFYYPTQLRAR